MYNRAQLDPRMLVWEYEGSKTLENFMTDPLFPLNLENYVYKRGQNPEGLPPPAAPSRATRVADGRQMETNKDDGRREAEMLRRIMSDILRATKVGTQL